MESPTATDLGNIPAEDNRTMYQKFMDNKSLGELRSMVKMAQKHLHGTIQAMQIRKLQDLIFKNYKVRR